MRLSYTKTLFFTCIAVLAVLSLAAVCFTLTPPETAQAQSELLLKNNIIRQTDISANISAVYGDMFNYCSNGDGKIYGKLTTGGYYNVSTNTDDDYYIMAKDILASKSCTADAETFSLCDENGYVCVDVSKNAYDLYYLTYKKDANKRTFFREIPIYYNKGESKGEPVKTAEGDSCVVSYYNSNENDIAVEVKRRTIELAFDPDPSKSHDNGGNALIPQADDESVRYIEHTYGDDFYAIGFKETDAGKKIMSSFGDVMMVSTVFAGNNAAAHVGRYDIETLNVDVWREVEVQEGDDIDALTEMGGHYYKKVDYNYNFNYDPSAETSIGYIKVVPRSTDVAAFLHEALFTTKQGETLDNLFNGEILPAVTLSTQGFSLSVDTGVSNQVVTVYYDVISGQEGMDEYDDEGHLFVAIGTWRIALVGWAVANKDPESEYVPEASDYQIRLVEDEDHYAQCKVDYRPIDLNDYRDTISLSREYGAYYNKSMESHQVKIEGVSVTLTFELMYNEEKSLSAYLDETGQESVCLPSGRYSFASVEVTDDPHYVVNVDKSGVYWEVTPKVVDYALLNKDGWSIGGAINVPQDVYAEAYSAARGDDASDKQSAMYGYLSVFEADTDGICIAEFAYDKDRTSISLDYRFIDADIAADCMVTLPMRVDACDPGYYCLSVDRSLGDSQTDNYTVGAGTLYVRVLPVGVTVSSIADSDYDGNVRQAVLLFDQAAASPFARWNAAALYNGKTDAPKDSGKYTLSVSISHDAAIDAQQAEVNPYLVFVGTQTIFEIRPKTVTVRLTDMSELTKVFYEQASSEDLSYTLSVGRLFGSDSVEFESEAFDESAAPNASGYPITVKIKKGNPSNYSLRLVDSDGQPNPTFVVTKFEADEQLRLYFDNFLKRQEEIAAKTATVDSITMEGINYYGIAVEGVAYEYATGSGSWTETASGISNLAEGTKYRVRIVIKKNGAHIDTDVDIFTDAIEITTAVVKPLIEQDLVFTTGHGAAIKVTNYDQKKRYTCVAFPEDVSSVPQNVESKALQLGVPDENELFYIARAYTIKDVDGDELLDQLTDFEVDNYYQVIVIARTDDAYMMSDVLTVRTRPAAPNVTTAAFTVSDKCITVPRGYCIYVAEVEDTGTLPVSSVVETTFQKAGISFADLAECGAEITDEYVASMTQNLKPNKTYVVAIWSQDEDSELASEVRFFTFKTLIDKNNRFSYSGGMLIASQYLLVGLLALNILLFVICTIRYAVLKKKLSGGNH